MKKKYTCKGCGGLCCENQHRPPFMLDEVEELPEDLRREIKTYDYRDGYPCIWLTLDGTCKHYDLRPQICRDFRPCSRNCKQMQQWRADWVERVRRQKEGVGK